MDYYVIRDVHTGFCLPLIKKGATKAEPCDPKLHAPRLFTTKRGATLALRAWQKGIHIASWDFADCEYGSGGGAYVDSISIRKIPSRARVMLEVAKAYLHVEAL